MRLGLVFQYVLLLLPARQDKGAQLTTQGCNVECGIIS